VEVLPEYAAYRPGSPLRVAFVFHLEKDWRLFWTNPGMPGMECPSVEWKLPDDWRADELQFPAPRRLGRGEASAFGYLGETALVATLVPSMDEESLEVTVQGKVRWMAANTEAVTGESKFTLTFRRSLKGPMKPLRADRFRLWQDSIPHGDPRLHPALRRRWLGKGWILEVPGEKGEARPEFFPLNRQVVDSRRPILGLYSDGVWTFELPPHPEWSPKSRSLEGVLAPGPGGGAPVWIASHLP
jgi:hypothetical protein